MRRPVRRGPATGAVSGRKFDPANAGGPLRTLGTDRVRITHLGVDVVERHVGRFESDVDNAGMVQRLRDIADGKLQPTAWDENFYTHELREFVRYRRLGWPDGEPADGDAARVIWNNTHTATLEEYALRGRVEDLYHPHWRH